MAKNNSWHFNYIVNNLLCLASHARSLDWLTEKVCLLAAKCAPNSVLSRSNYGVMFYQVGDLKNAEKN